MKVFIFSESYEPVRNGVAVSIATLRDELRRLGHQVYVAAPSFKGYDDADPHVYRFPSVRTRRAPDYPLAVPYLPKFMENIRTLNPDVIHTHTPFTLGILGMKIAKRLDIPLVSTNHTQYAEYAHYCPVLPVRATRSFITRHMRSYYNQCHGIVVPSDPVIDILKGYGIETPIVSIPTGNSINCVIDPEVRAAVRKEYGIPEDSKILLYAGRLAKEKNLGLLINSFDQIAPMHQNTYLMLIGGGPFEDECRAMAKHSEFSERIKFTGSIPRETLARYYSVGDIFVFPSTTETQGLVVCEAMSAGLPGVVVNQGGSAEMLTDGEDGLLAENDVSDFTEKINRLLSDSELLARLSEGAIKNSCRYTPHEMAKQMLAAYDLAIARHREQAIG